MSKLIKNGPRKNKELESGGFYTACHHAHGKQPARVVIRFGLEGPNYSAEFTIDEAEKIANNFAEYVKRAKEYANG